MIRQYNPGRFRNMQTKRGTLHVGTINVGDIIRPHNCTSNVEVLGWVPRDYASYERGKFTTKRIAGGHLALVRNLRDGRVFELSDVWLIDR